MEADSKQVGGNHYKRMEVSPWDVIDTWPIEQQIGAYRAGILKYTMRMGSKDESAQEIGKAKHYAEKLEEVLQKAHRMSQIDQILKRNEIESHWVEGK